MKANKKKSSAVSIAKASHSDARVAPRKARLVADQIRGMNVVQAIAILENTRRRANPLVLNVLKSAVANAVEKDNSVDQDKLIVTEARVDKGRTFKRLRARAMGRGSLIMKHHSHITLAVG